MWQVRFDLTGTSDLWGPKRGGLWMWKLVTTPLVNVSSSLFTFQGSTPQVKQISYQIFGRFVGIITEVGVQQRQLQLRMIALTNARSSCSSSRGASHDILFFL